MAIGNECSAFSRGSRWFLLYNYLVRNARKECPKSRAQIFEYLSNYDISITIGTFYSDLDAMGNEIFQLDIVFDPHANRGAGGYWVKNPPFEPHELRFLVDSIQASRFITQQTADTISRKIRQIAGEADRKTLNRSAVVFNRVKSINESVVKEADRFYEAIANNKKIAFRYFHRTPNREQPQKYSKAGEMLIVSPYAMVWNGGNYYLYAYNGKKFLTYRVDRMDRISKPLLEDREGTDEYNKNALTDQKAVVFDMYHGAEQRVQFRCHNRIADAVIDRFGDGVLLIPCDADHFNFTASVEISPPFFAWVATFGHSIKIVSPAGVIAKMRKFLQDAQDMCKEEAEM